MDIARGQSGIVFKGNDFWTYGGAFSIRWSKGNYTSLSAWQTKAAQSGNLSVVPKFVNNDGLTLGTAQDFRLDSTSGLKDAGVNLWQVTLLSVPGQPAGPGTRDYYGSALPLNSQSAVFSIGANEI
jgi:hypothetical protein